MLYDLTANLPELLNTTKLQNRQAPERSHAPNPRPQPPAQPVDRAQVSGLDGVQVPKASGSGCGFERVQPALTRTPSRAAASGPPRRGAEGGGANRVSGAQAEGRRDGRQSGPLVSNAKSSTPPKKTATELRAERYELQATARDLLMWQGKQKGLYHPANHHHTAKCLHVRIAPEVQVHRSKEHAKAFYAGLVVCGRVWTCPVCAAKIQERRRLEIARAFDHAYSTGRKVVMVTFTFPHYAADRLADLLAKQADAFKRLRAGKPWERIKDRHGYGGLIRSLEVTLGANGWHPHTHEAWLVSADCNAYKLRNEVARRWVKMCQKAGLAPDDTRKLAAFLRRGVQITDNCRASEYLAKQDDSRHWGADRELAKSNSKTSRSAKGFHPFALLREHADGGETRKDAGSRYLEYAEAMRGKPQLFWSHGLKAEVGLDEKTDEELALEQTDAADLLSRLTPHHWKIILRNKARATILDIAEAEGAAGIDRWLAEHQESTEGDYLDVGSAGDYAAAAAKQYARMTKPKRQPKPKPEPTTPDDEMDKLLSEARSALAAESRGVQGS